MYHSVGDRKTQHNLYVPEHFDPDLYLKKYHDEARWFVHSIFLRRVLDRREPDGFVPLHSAILKRMMGDRPYRKIIESLITGGVVECDNTWVRTEKSKGYRLTSSLRGQRHKKYVLDPGSAMAKRLDWWRLTRSLEVHLDVHRQLRDQFAHLEIDFPTDLTDLDPAAVQQAAMIQDQEWYFVPCPYGRVHTNLSSLDSRLRKCLRANGKRLVNLDIRNSQPLLACVLLLKYYQNGCSLGSLSSFISSDHSYLPESGNPSSSLPHTLSGATFNSSLPPDVNEYIQWTQRGEMYDRLMARWGIAPERRNEFKRDFFGQIMYCRDHRRYEYGRLFERDFPNATEVFEVLKAKDYTQAAKLMQRVESTIMINRVARRVMAEHPDAPVYTIHDSVLTHAEFAEPVGRIIRQEFGRVGLCPTIRTEDYSLSS